MVFDASHLSKSKHPQNQNASQILKHAMLARSNSASFTDRGGNSIESLQQHIRKEMNAGRFDNAKQIASKVAYLRARLHAQTPQIKPPELDAAMIAVVCTRILNHLPGLQAKCTRHTHVCVTLKATNTSGATVHGYEYRPVQRTGSQTHDD